MTDKIFVIVVNFRVSYSVWNNENDKHEKKVYSDICVER